MKPLLAALLCIMPLIASARIGETLDQCIARYGKPITLEPSEPHQIFHKDGLTIGCHFRSDGLCWKMVIMEDKDAIPKGSLVENNAAARIMNENGVDWKVLNTDKSVTRYSNRTLTAYFDEEPGRRLLIIAIKADLNTSRAGKNP